MRAESKSVCASSKDREGHAPSQLTRVECGHAGSPAAEVVLSLRSLVWLPEMTWRSKFSGDGGRFWARVARSALRYCSRVTWRTECITGQVRHVVIPPPCPPLAHKQLNQVGESHQAG